MPPIDRVETGPSVDLGHFSGTAYPRARHMHIHNETIRPTRTQRDPKHHHKARHRSVSLDDTGYAAQDGLTGQLGLVRERISAAFAGGGGSIGLDGRPRHGTGHTGAGPALERRQVRKQSGLLLPLLGEPGIALFLEMTLDLEIGKRVHAAGAKFAEPLVLRLLVLLAQAGSEAGAHVGELALATGQNASLGDFPRKARVVGIFVADGRVGPEHAFVLFSIKARFDDFAVVHVLVRPDDLAAVVRKGDLVSIGADVAIAGTDIHAVCEPLTGLGVDTVPCSLARCRIDDSDTVAVLELCVVNILEYYHGWSLTMVEGRYKRQTYFLEQSWSRPPA